MTSQSKVITNNDGPDLVVVDTPPVASAQAGAINGKSPATDLAAETKPFAGQAAPILSAEHHEQTIQANSDNNADIAAEPVVTKPSGETVQRLAASENKSEDGMQPVVQQYHTAANDRHAEKTQSDRGVESAPSTPAQAGPDTVAGNTSARGNMNNFNSGSENPERFAGLMTSADDGMPDEVFDMNAESSGRAFAVLDSLKIPGKDNCRPTGSRGWQDAIQYGRCR